MRSQAKKIEMLEKLSKILKLLPTTHSIKEISEQTEIPTSTIQRYLNDRKLIIELLETIDNPINSEEICNYNHEWLKASKEKGRSDGGHHSQDKYGYTKGEDGKFNGNNKYKKVRKVNNCRR